MTKIASSRGAVVDFDMLKIMSDINAPKSSNTSNTPKPKKFYELPEEEIPYVDSYTTEELLKKHLDNIPKVDTVNKPETLKVENVIEVKMVEEPVPLIISKPVINEIVPELISETLENKDNNEKRRR